MTGLKSSIGIRRLIAGLFLTLLALAPVAMWAQGEASISGVVADMTGAVIAGATVKVQNVETGATRAMVTDAAGRYDTSLLPVGKYAVTAEQTGFRKSQADITLVLGQRASVDLKLAIGGTQQSISVEETALDLLVTTAEF